MTTPPFTISLKILDLCSSIGEVVGQYEGLHSPQPQVQLRKENRIRTIQASLAIEGNTLKLDQVTALFDQKRIVAPPRDIREVQNAIQVYDRLSDFKASSIKSFLVAHKLLLAGLIDDAGQWRSGNVGIVKNKKVTHVAPKSVHVPKLMKALFDFLKREKELHYLIRATVFHYELEFIHPFSDGNGRMGRLWQAVILSQHQPIFQYLPTETLIKSRQDTYYRALADSDKKGESTPFIEFMLGVILESLRAFLSDLRPKPLTAESRLQHAKSHFGARPFSRGDYLALFKSLSTATASRDLAHGVGKGALSRTGDKALARYEFK